MAQSLETEIIEELGKLVSRGLNINVEWLTSWHPLLIFSFGYFTLFYLRRETFKDFSTLDKVMWAAVLGFPLYVYLIFLFIAASVAAKVTVLEAAKVWVAILVMAGVLLISIADVRKILRGSRESLVKFDTRLKLIVKLIPAGVIVALFLPAPIAAAVGGGELAASVEGAVAFGTIAGLFLLGPPLSLRLLREFRQPLSDLTAGVTPKKLRELYFHVAYSVNFRNYVFGTSSTEKLMLLAGFGLGVLTALVLAGVKAAGTINDMIILTGILLVPIPFTLFWLHKVIPDTIHEGINWLNKELKVNH